MSIQRKLYLDRIGKIEESIVKGTKKQDEPFTVVAMKNNKVVDQFSGAEYKELGEVIKYVKTNNKGAKISVESRRGKIVHTEEVEQVDEASVYKRPAKISALGGQKNHAIVDSKGNIIHIGMSEKDARKIRQFGQKVMELPGARVGQKIKEDVDVDEKKMDPRKHVARSKKNPDMFCVFDKDGKEVKLFKNKSDAEKYATDNHDSLMESLDEETYDEFFAKAMKKFGISSPADLKDEKKKKEFFNYVDKNYKAKDESVEEEEMSDAEMKQREKIVKGLKKSKKEFEDRYGEKAMDVMYATATKMAMKDSVDYDEANAIIEKYLKGD